MWISFRHVSLGDLMSLFCSQTRLPDSFPEHVLLYIQSRQRSGKKIGQAMFLLCTLWETLGWGYNTMVENLPGPSKVMNSMSNTKERGGKKNQISHNKGTNTSRFWETACKLVKKAMSWWKLIVYHLQFFFALCSTCSSRIRIVINHAKLDY